MTAPLTAAHGPTAVRRDVGETRASAIAVGRSLWDDQLSGAAPCPPLVGEHRAEAVIVGAGITGLSAALHLAPRDVVVLDARQPGWGASGRNGGSVIAGLKTDPDVLERQFGPDLGPRMAAAVGGAADAVFALIERHGIACGARRAGWVSAAHTPRALGALGARAEQWRRRGVQIQVLDRAGIRALTGSDAHHGGLLDPSGGAIQPAAYTRGLADAASRAGARLFGDSPALSLARDGADWIVRTPRGSVTAPRVLLGTNGYTDRLWPGLRRTVLPAWSMQIATEPLAPSIAAGILPGGHAVSDTRHLLRYFRREPDGRFVIGARAAFRDFSRETDIAPLSADMRALYPALACARITHAWSGRVAMTTDHLPHLHVLAPGVFAALGYNGRGVAMATVLGRVLAKLATGGAHDGIDFPVTGARPIPLHGLSRVGARAVTQYYRLLDSRA